MGKVSVDVGLFKKQNVSTRCDVFKLVTGIYGPHMEPSHWWYRWSTPIQSKNPFKPDLEDLSQLFGPIEENSTPAEIGEPFSG